MFLVTVAAMLYLDYAHAKERQNLYNRIQAKDLMEVKAMEAPRKENKEEKKEEIVYL